MQRLRRQEQVLVKTHQQVTDNIHAQLLAGVDHAQFAGDGLQNEFQPDLGLLGAVGFVCQIRPQRWTSSLHRRSPEQKGGALRTFLIAFTRHARG